MTIMRIGPLVKLRQRSRSKVAIVNIVRR